MTGLVFDASASLACIVPSQGTQASSQFRDSLTRGLIEPFHFCLEIRRAILRLERNKSVLPGSLDQALQQVDDLVEIFADDELFPIANAFDLARPHRLGMYDAVYLLMGIRVRAPIVSRNGPLIAASHQAGLAVVDLR
jgi:predicted nucleic acid-binding protein